MQYISKKYNCFGKLIQEPAPVLANVQYGLMNTEGVLEPDWEKWKRKCEFTDDDGFDLRNIEENGERKEREILSPGTMICRYGHWGGRFTTLKGTPYECLALPYLKETIEYHEYIVLEETEVECLVIRGIAAPLFGSIGGGVQFKHFQSIRN